MSFMRSQWGSCSASGKITLNTHLIKTPRRLIDYVVLHELCHLRQHNHNRRFYGLLATHMSDWSARSTELDRFMPVLLHE
jgi:predicted metal-dependent hydrolase